MVKSLSAISWKSLRGENTFGGFSDNFGYTAPFFALWFIFFLGRSEKLLSLFASFFFLVVCIQVVIGNEERISVALAAESRELRNEGKDAQRGVPRRGGINFSAVSLGARSISAGRAANPCIAFRQTRRRPVARYWLKSSVLRRLTLVPATRATAGGSWKERRHPALPWRQMIQKTFFFFFGWQEHCEGFGVFWGHRIQSKSSST